MENRFLFVLCPPFCGSTVLGRLLATSPAVSAMEVEGQLYEEVREDMEDSRWDPRRTMPWEKIKAAWMEKWDLSKPILAEKSPPSLVRAPDIEQVFRPAWFVAMVRNPYAAAEGARRRTGMNWELCADYWVRFARMQRRNCEVLERVCPITYEELSDRPEETVRKLLDFLPELESLDPRREFEATTVHGHGRHPIRNYNEDKLRILDENAFAAINSVLERNQDLVEAFGYSLRESAPTPPER